METTIFETPSKQQIKYSEYMHGTNDLHFYVYKLKRGHKTFMKHLHSEYEIVYLIDHYLDFYVNEEVYHLLPGQALFIDRDIMHGHADVNRNYGSYISFHFGENFIFPDSKSHIYNQYFVPLASGVYTFTKHISGRTPYENQILNIVSKLVPLSDNIEANALSIQICLLRIFDIMSRENAFDINQSSQQQHEIDTHPGCNLTEVALKAGFSDSNYFARTFKNKMGISPSAYKQQKVSPKT